MNLKKFKEIGFLLSGLEKPWEKSALANALVEASNEANKFKGRKHDAIKFLNNVFCSTLAETNDYKNINEEIRSLGHFLRICSYEDENLKCLLSELISGLHSQALTLESSGEKQTLKNIISYLKSNRHENLVIFDIGANIGEWSNVALENTEASLDLHAFEPNTELISQLKVQLNDASQERKFSTRIYINNAGVANVTGKIPLYVHGNNHELSTISKNVSENCFTNEYRGLTIDSIRGDEYCSKNCIQNIDILKIDTEGTDLEVLQSFQLSSRKINARFIQFEYGKSSYYSGFGLKGFFELLEETHLIAKILPEGLYLIPEYTEDIEDFMWSNYLAVNKADENFYKNSDLFKLP